MFSASESSFAWALVEKVDIPAQFLAKDYGSYLRLIAAIYIVMEFFKIVSDESRQLDFAVHSILRSFAKYISELLLIVM